MIRAFYRLIDKKMILLLIIMLIASPVLFGINNYTACLIYSHYLTVYLNNAFILMLYQYASRLNSLNLFLITRIHQESYYQYSYLVFLSVGILYNIIIYISYYFFFGHIPPEYVTLTCFFMIINMIITAIQMHIIFAQLGKKKNFAFLAFPILINFAFHFIFINLF